MRHEAYMKMKAEEESMASLQSMANATWAADEEKLLDEAYLKQQDKEHDNVNHPPHYNQAGIECLDAIAAATGDGFQYYLQGNILKYLWRYRYKNGLEDLKKAQFYLNKLIATREDNNE